MKDQAQMFSCRGFRNIVICNPPTDSGSELFGRKRNLTQRRKLLGMTVGSARTTMLTGATAIVAFGVVPSASAWAPRVDARKHKGRMFEGRMPIGGTGKSIRTRKAAVVRLAVVVRAGAWAIWTDTWKSPWRLESLSLTWTWRSGEKFTNTGVGA